MKVEFRPKLGGGVQVLLGMECSTMTDTGGTATVSIFSGSSVIAEYDNGVAPASPSYAASAATSSGSMLDPSQAYSAMPTKQAAGTR